LRLALTGIRSFGLAGAWIAGAARGFLAQQVTERAPEPFLRRPLYHLVTEPGDPLPRPAVRGTMPISTRRPSEADRPAE